MKKSLPIFHMGIFCFFIGRCDSVTCSYSPEFWKCKDLFIRGRFTLTSASNKGSVNFFFSLQ